jgi:hypothetical protein
VDLSRRPFGGGNTHRCWRQGRQAKKRMSDARRRFSAPLPLPFSDRGWCSCLLLIAPTKNSRRMVGFIEASHMTFLEMERFGRLRNPRRVLLPIQTTQATDGIRCDNLATMAAIVTVRREEDGPNEMAPPIRVTSTRVSAVRAHPTVNQWSQAWSDGAGDEGPRDDKGARCAWRRKELVAWVPRVSGCDQIGPRKRGQDGPRTWKFGPSRGLLFFSFYFSLPFPI